MCQIFQSILPSSLSLPWAVVGEVGFFQSGWTVGFLIGTIVGAVLAWLGCRSREEKVRIASEGEKRELAKELSDLQKSKLELAEENQILSRLQGESLVQNNMLLDELENLKGFYEEKVELFKETNLKLTELERARESAVEVDMDGDLFGRPIDRESVEVLSNQSVMSGGSVMVIREVLEEIAALRAEQASLLVGIRERYCSRRSDVGGIMVSGLMDLLPEDPNSFQEFIQNEGIEDYCEVLVPELEDEDFSGDLTSCPTVEAELKLVDALRLQINFRLWRQLSTYNLFTLTKAVTSSIASFAEHLRLLPSDKEAPLVVLLPRERRVCKLVFAELEQNGVDLGRFVFANMGGLSRFINDAGVLQKGEKLDELVSRIESQLDEEKELGENESV